MIETARLIIRRFTAGDLRDFLAYQADPVVRRYAKGAAMSPEQAADYLAAQAVLDAHALDAWHGFAVEKDGRVIGDVGVWLDSATAGSGDVGFQFHPGHHGRGYAREAMEAFLVCVFETLGLHRVTAGCDPENKSSRVLLERLGMRKIDGTAVQYELVRSPE